MYLSGLLIQPTPVLMGFPLPEREFPTPEQKERQAAASLSGKRVVIVEDEIITQMQLRKILTRNGLQVVYSAIDGAEGIAATLQERPDLVLMDIRLPGDVDGLEALRRIVEQVAVCVVMLTAVPNQEFQDKARELGACGYIIKPIDRDTLFPQLQAAVDRFTER